MQPERGNAAGGLLATPMRLRRVRDAFAAPKPDFFQAGIMRLAERFLTDLMTQPGEPSRQESLAHLADTAELFASMVWGSARNTARNTDSSRE